MQRLRDGNLTRQMQIFPPRGNLPRAYRRRRGSDPQKVTAVKRFPVPRKTCDNSLASLDIIGVSYLNSPRSLARYRIC